MPGLEEILITLLGRDEVTPVVNNIASNTQSQLNGMVNSAQDIGSAYNSTFDQIGSGIRTLNYGMLNLSSMSGMVMRELGSTKSAMDWVYGTTSKEDTNKVLVGNMAKTQEEYDSLYNTIDKVTDNSLTSMQELIPALNAFRSATQATAGQLENDVTEDMAQFGAFVLAQTGSTQLALTAMMDLSKGIKGRYASLDQYGISAEALKATGKWREAEGGSKTKNWTGDEKDIKGYMDAVTDVIGSTDDLMNTNEGLNAQMGKMWSRAGKRIGHEMMPGLKSLKQMFIDLDTEMNGDLSTAVLRVALGIEEIHNKAYQLNTFYDASRNLWSIFQRLAGWIGLTSTATENNTLQTQANSDAILQNTAELDANTQARLANADASMLMGNAMMGADMGDMMPDNAPSQTTPTTSTGGIVGDVASDVALDQLLSSRDKDTAGADIKSLENLKRKQEESAQIMDILEKSEADKEDIRKIVNTMTNGQADDELVEKIANAYTDDSIQKVKDAYNRSARLDNEPLTSTTKVKESIENVEKLLHPPELEEGLKEIPSPTSDTVTKFLPKPQDVEDVWEDIENEADNTNLRTFEKLENFLTKKEKRNLPKVPDFDSDGQIESRFIMYKNNLKKPFKKGFDRLKDSKDILDDAFEKNAVEGVSKGSKMDNIWDGLKGAFSSLRGKDSPAKMISEVADDADEIIDGGEALAETAGGAGAIGTGMAEAETGLSFMALSEMGLASAFTTLIVPTLAVAGVIAVLIPIIAGLAIEALFFINIVAQMMEAMNFEDIDVSGAVESLQEIATAFAWLGVAMASMTFAGLMSSIGMAVASLLSIVGGFPQVVDLLTQIADEIRPLGEMESLDPSIASNLETLGSALNSISMAMLSLTGVQLTSWIGGIVTGFGLFGTLTDTIDRAKSDIEHAISSINSMNVGTIDENKVNQIKTVMEAIKAFGDAFSGLTKIRTDEAISDFVSWLLAGGIFGNGGKSIGEAFSQAHDDIVSASQAISGFTDISEIDETTVDRLTKVGDSIKAMGDAFEGLRKIRDSYNWDDMFSDDGVLSFLGGKYDIASALDQSKDDIVKISKSLKGLDGKLANIPKKVGERLQKVSDTLTSITNAFDQLKKLNDMGGKNGVNFKNYTTMIETARKELAKVSKELSALSGGKKENDLVDMPADLDTKLSHLVTTLTNIAYAIDNLSNINEASNSGANMKGYTTMISTARKELAKVSRELKGMLNGKGDNDVVNIPEGLDTRLKRMATTLENIAKAVQALATVDSVVGGSDSSALKFEQYKTLITNAKTGLGGISRELKGMLNGKGGNDVVNIPEGLDTRLSNMITTLTNIAYALENLKMLDQGYSTASSEGFKKYQTLISNAKTGLSEISVSLKDLNKGGKDGGLANIKPEVATKLQTVTDTLKKVGDALTEAEDIFDQFGGKGQQPSNNGTKTIKSPFMNVNTDKGDGKNETNIQQYKKTIEDGAKRLVEVSGILKDLKGKDGLAKVDGVSDRISNVKSALSKLKEATTTMTSFPKVEGGQNGATATNVRNAVATLRRASQYLKWINKSDKVGEVKGIIGNIKTALNELHDALKTMDFKDSGSHIGGRIKSGIGSGLKGLGTTISTRITNATRSASSAGWTMGSTIGNSVSRGFESALRLVEIVSAQLQQAQLELDNATANANLGGDFGTVATEGENAGSGGNGDSQSANGNTTGGTTGASVLLRTSRAMVNSLNNSNYTNLKHNRLNSSRIESMSKMNKKSNLGKGQQSVNINIGEGAIQLDARNLTTKESRQVMINALEGLNDIKNINLRGNPQ